MPSSRVVPSGGARARPRSAAAARSRARAAPRAKVNFQKRPQSAASARSQSCRAGEAQAQGGGRQPRCICEICICGLHHCPLPPHEHPGMRAAEAGASESTYHHDYRPWGLQRREAASAKDDGYKGGAPFFGESTHRRDYHQHDAVPRRGLARLSRPDEPLTGVKFEGQSSYKTDFCGKRGKPAQRVQHRDAHAGLGYRAPFFGGTEYRTRYVEFDVEAAGPGLAQRPPQQTADDGDREFYGRSTHQEDYRRWKASRPAPTAQRKAKTEPIKDRRSFWTAHRAYHTGKQDRKCLSGKLLRQLPPRSHNPRHAYKGRHVFYNTEEGRWGFPSSRGSSRRGSSRPGSAPFR